MVSIQSLKLLLYGRALYFYGPQILFCGKGSDGKSRIVP